VVTDIPGTLQGAIYGFGNLGEVTLPALTESRLSFLWEVLRWLQGRWRATASSPYSIQARRRKVRGACPLVPGVQSSWKKHGTGFHGKAIVRILVTAT